MEIFKCPAFSSYVPHSVSAVAQIMAPYCPFYTSWRSIGTNASNRSVPSHNQVVKLSQQCPFLTMCKQRDYTTGLEVNLQHESFLPGKIHKLKEFYNLKNPEPQEEDSVKDIISPVPYTPEEKSCQVSATSTEKENPETDYKSYFKKSHRYSKIRRPVSSI